MTYIEDSEGGFTFIIYATLEVFWNDTCEITLNRKYQLEAIVSSTGKYLQHVIIKFDSMR